jgi:hypothetical protein
MSLQPDILIPGNGQFSDHERAAVYRVIFERRDVRQNFFGILDRGRCPCEDFDRGASRWICWVYAAVGFCGHPSTRDETRREATLPENECSGGHAL